jgi:modulator of FtsH protease
VGGSLTALWSDFAVAVVGAAAALTGLLFVAVSINVERILAAAALTSRSASTMIFFAIPLLVGTLLLVPEQSPGFLGLELIATGLAAAGSLLWVNRPSRRGEQEPRSSWLLLRFGTSVTVPAFLVVAGMSVLIGAGGGLYWIAPAVIEAFLAGLLTVWVLLIEIRR